VLGRAKRAPVLKALGILSSNHEFKTVQIISTSVYSSFLY